MCSYDASSVLSLDSSNIRDIKSTIANYDNKQESMTSSSWIMSSGAISDDGVTSWHDNRTSTDVTSLEDNLTTFSLTLCLTSQLRDKSSDDDEINMDYSKRRHHRKKTSPRLNMVKDKQNIRLSPVSSPYPSSTTSSLQGIYTSKNSFDNGNIDAWKDNCELYNHYVESKNSASSNSIDDVTPLSDDDIIMPLSTKNNRMFQKFGDFLKEDSMFPPIIPEEFKIIFNVCGKIFEIDSRKLDCYPNTLLGNRQKRHKYFDYSHNEYFLDRHRGTFEVILDFYLNGGLLIRPDDIPIDIFMIELKFYAFDHSTLEQFLRDEGILHVPKQKPLPNGKIKNFIWKLFENHESSYLSAIVTILSALIIVLSVVVFCLESLPYFESLNGYVDNTIKPGLIACQDVFNNRSNQSMDAKQLDQPIYQWYVNNEQENKINRKIMIESRPILNIYSVEQVTDVMMQTLEQCVSMFSELSLPHRLVSKRCLVEIIDQRGSLIDILQNIRFHDDSNVFTLVTAQSVVVVMSQTHRLRHDKADTTYVTLLTKATNESKDVIITSPTNIGNENAFTALKEICPLLEDKSTRSPYEWFVMEACMGSPAGILFGIETCCIVWFVLELILRFLCCPDKKKFVKSFLNVVDTLAILPYFITLIVTTIETKTDLRPQTATILRTIRLVRMLRILKLSRYFRGFRILGLTLVRSTRVLFLLVCFQVVLAVLFSSIVYFVEYDEEKTQFKSIPDSFWWALITMTTVGYGDVVPITVLGKICGACCAIMGILSISFPVPVVVSNFNYLYNLDKDDCKLIPEDLMEDEEDEEDDQSKTTNIDKFQENLFQAIRKSSSGFLESTNEVQKNPAELWNIAKRQYRKMSTVSIDARLDKSPSRSISTQNTGSLQKKLSVEYLSRLSEHATSL